MTLTNLRNGITVFDGKRRVAVARKNAHGWLMTATGFCWIDEAARKPNLFGIVNSSLWFVKSKREALREMKSINV